MSSIFFKIVNGELPAYKIAETSEFLAFLDVRPLASGHTLVIPKKETDYIFDLEDQSYQALFLFAKKVAKAIKKVVPCKKVGVAIIGLEVPHAHIHLVPINSVGDINFASPKLTFTAEELEKVSSQVRQAYEAL